MPDHTTPSSEPRVTLDDVGELLARSQKLKDEATRLLTEAAQLDRRIEAALEASLAVARGHPAPDSQAA